MKKIEPGIDTRRIARRSVAFMVAAAMIGLLSASSLVRADDSVGSVTQLSGNAQIERGTEILPAEQGTPVKLHDEVTTHPGASATLGFADGSSMTLSGSTNVTIDDTTTVNGQTVPSRATLISGDVQTHVPDGQPHRIEVNTPTMKVTGASPNQ